MFLQKLKLGSKFNLLLTAAFLSALLLSSLVLSQVLENRARGEVTSKALMLMQTMNSVRDYTSTRIQPLLKPRLETDSTFIAETVPAYSATEIFRQFRERDEYKDFFYKEATLNPTNPRDKSVGVETTLVEQFQKEPDRKELSGFLDLSGGKVFYIARPLAVKKESCLQCHSTPDRAPKSQIATYGSENGFGWKLNDVVAAQMITVPANEVLDSARRSFVTIMAILSGIFLALVLLINALLKRTVIRPIRRMANAAEAISMGQMDIEFEQNSQDEIGALAAAFNRMKSSLQISINLLNKRQ
ncbi:MAG: histidine kinase [Leptolyngbya sp. ERB_1_1]